MKNSWRITLIGMLTCAALAACSPDEQTGTATPPSAPAQQMPEASPALTENAPPMQSAPVETPAQPAPEAQPQPQPQPQPGNRAVLSWTAPTQYTDGSVLPDADLAGFRIYHGPSEGSLSPVAEVDGEEFSMTIEDLAIGTHYFAVTTVTVSGMESSFSAIGSKRVM